MVPSRRAAATWSFPRWYIPGCDMQGDYDDQVAGNESSVDRLTCRWSMSLRFERYTGADHERYEQSWEKGDPEKKNLFPCLFSYRTSSRGSLLTGLAGVQVHGFLGRSRCRFLVSDHRIPLWV